MNFIGVFFDLIEGVIQTIIFAERLPCFPCFRSFCPGLENDQRKQVKTQANGRMLYLRPSAQGYSVSTGIPRDLTQCCFQSAVLKLVRSVDSDRFGAWSDKYQLEDLQKELAKDLALRLANANTPADEVAETMRVLEGDI